MQQAPKRYREKNHLSLRLGPAFEASAGGAIAVVILGIVALAYVAYLIIS